MGLSLRGQTSGAVDINAPAEAGDNTITLPDGNGSANQFYKNSTTAGIVTHSSMVEDASGNIGIGTDNPAQKLDVIGNIRVNNGNLGINTTTVATGVNVAVGGTIRVQDSTDATQYLTINHQGIDFQNTGAGSSTSVTAHTLDDYEEGTWTPNVTGGGVSWITQNGRYTKVGNLVVVNYWLQASGTSSSSGTFSITGLPFALAAVDTRPTGAVRAYSLQNFSGKSGCVAWSTNTSTEINIVPINGNGLAEGTNLNHNVWQNGAELHCTFSYQTDD